MAEDKNMELYEQLQTPPNDAVKPIKAGRLKGKSDINTQWRYEALTQVFGACGVGWKYEIADIRMVDLPSSGEKMVYIMVKLQWFDKESGKWSEPIFGWGGDFIVVKDKWGLHGNDEAMKMATTDALGTAAKQLGVGADVYRGKLENTDGLSDSKYGEARYTAQNAQNGAGRTQAARGTNYTNGIKNKVYTRSDLFNYARKVVGLTDKQLNTLFCEHYKGVKSTADLTPEQIAEFIHYMDKWAARDEL